MRIAIKLIRTFNCRYTYSQHSCSASLVPSHGGFAACRNLWIPFVYAWLACLDMVVCCRDSSEHLRSRAALDS